MKKENPKIKLIELFEEKPFILKEEKHLVKRPIQRRYNERQNKMSENQATNLTREEIFENLKIETKSCTKCILSRTRTNVVFGEGDINADLMIIGEGPGRKEDETGRPFVGRSGNLLTKMLKAINIEREEVFIANIVKCRPPGNRDPLAEEVKSCIPYLHKQIEIIKPKIICALGRVAAFTLLSNLETNKLGDLREKIWSYQNTPFMVTYHPAALLRNVKLKRLAWKDLQEMEYFLKNGQFNEYQLISS